VHVQVAAGDASVAAPFEEAEGRGLDRQAPQADAADEHHGLADALGADRVGLGRRVGEAQQVRTEALVALERLDQVRCRGVLVVAQRDDVLDGRVEDREVGERGDRAGAVLGAVRVDGGHSARAIRCVRSLHGCPSASSAAGGS
jgi:hypothetical protein